MPVTILINGQFLKKLCIGNWACIFDDSVSRQSTGWRFTVTHIGRPPISVQCALCSCPQGAHCACILLCIETPKPTNVQLVAKRFVVRRIWKWVNLKKKWPTVCDVLPIATCFVTMCVTDTRAHSCCVVPCVCPDPGEEPLVVNLRLVLYNVKKKKRVK